MTHESVNAQGASRAVPKPSAPAAGPGTLSGGLSSSASQARVQMQTLTVGLGSQRHGDQGEPGKSESGPGAWGTWTGNEPAWSHPGEAAAGVQYHLPPVSLCATGLTLGQSWDCAPRSQREPGAAGTPLGRHPLLGPTDSDISPAQGALQCLRGILQLA